MNTDVKDILKRIKIQNPVAAGGVGLLVVAIIAFVLAAIRLGTNLVVASQAQADLAVVQDGIDQILSLQTANPESLQRQITQTNRQIAELLLGFPTTAEATEQAARFYEYATQADVQLVSLEPLRNTPEEEAQSAYTVQRYFVVAQGAVPGLLRFVARLGSRPLETLRLTDMAIYQDQGTRADIDLIVYASDLALEERHELASAGPSTVAGLEQMARTARDAQEWETVVKHASRILELEPAHVEASLWLYEAYVSWAEQLEAEGELDPARDKFEAALQIRPEGQEALAGLERLSQP